MTWISVNDRLPELSKKTEDYPHYQYSEDVLVTDGTTIDISSRYYRHWGYDEGYGEDIEEYWDLIETGDGFSRVKENEISHWMPLPELPKEIR